MMPADDELVRLLNALVMAGRRSEGSHGNDFGMIVDARAALLAYLDREYVRRDANRLPASPPGSYRAARGVVPWQPGDELPEVAIRRLRDSEGDGDD